MRPLGVRSKQPAMATVKERWLIFVTEWAVASAVFDLVLAAIILAGPASATRWAISLLVAVNITLGGLALGAMAWANKSWVPARIFRGAEATFLKHFGP